MHMCGVWELHPTLLPLHMCNTRGKRLNKTKVGYYTSLASADPSLLTKYCAAYYTCTCVNLTIFLKHDALDQGRDKGGGGQKGDIPQAQCSTVYLNTSGAPSARHPGHKPTSLAKCPWVLSVMVANVAAAGISPCQLSLRKGTEPLRSEGSLSFLLSLIIM